MSSGMDELGKTIADGRGRFAETLDTLVSAHVRLFGLPGTPGSMYRLEERITNRLIEVTEKYTDKNKREWYPQRSRVLPELKSHGTPELDGIDR